MNVNVERERETLILCQRIRWERKEWFCGSLWLSAECTRPIHERTKRATTLRENWLHIWIWNKYIYMNARIIAIIVTVKAISLCRCLGFMSDNNAFCCALFISLFASLSQSPSVPIHKRCCLQCSNVCVFIHPLCVLYKYGKIFMFFQCKAKELKQIVYFGPMSDAELVACLLFRRHFVYITKAFGAFTKKYIYIFLCYIRPVYCYNKLNR